MQSVNVDERVNQINKELNDFKDRLERAETVYNDETRMREIVENLVEPIILIAKQNALTNCYKNDELQTARDEVRDLNERIISFKKQIEILQELDQKITRTNEEIRTDMNKTLNSFTPTRKLAEKCKDEVHEMKGKMREIRQSLSQREQRLIDLENLFIEHQRQTKEDVLNKVQQNIDAIEEMHPKIQHMTNVSAQCEQYFNQSKEELSKMHQKVQESQTKVKSVQRQLEDLKHSKIADMDVRIKNNITQVQEIFRQLTSSNIRMSQIDDTFTQINKQINDLNRFTIFQQPVLTHMQISDILQEFLCIPDQMKLMQFDNLKFKQMQSFRDQFLDPSSHSKSPSVKKFEIQLQHVEECIKEFKNGYQRLNFEKDFQLDILNNEKRIKELREDMKSKGDLIGKIYRFERQMFLAQGKISGQISQTQDIVDETVMRDAKANGDNMEELVNLQDPNHRLRQFLQYQNQKNLNTVTKANEQLKQSLEQQRMREPPSGSMSEKDKSSSIQLGRAFTAIEQTTNKLGSKTEIRSINEGEQMDNQEFVTQKDIKFQNSTQRGSEQIMESVKNRLRNADMKGHPDFNMLPNDNCCSRCGFRNNRFGNIQNNNHMQGSGMQNVIYEVVFVRSQTKVDRIHHRFLAKKRAWLTRQIDPQKRYLHALNKQARIQELQKQEVIDSDADEYAGHISIEQSNKFGGVEASMAGPYDDMNERETEDDNVMQDQVTKNQDDQVPESLCTDNDNQQIDDQHSTRNDNKTYKIASNTQSQKTFNQKAQVSKLYLDSNKENGTSKNTIVSKQTTNVGQNKTDVSKSQKLKSTRRGTKPQESMRAVEKEVDVSMAESSKQLQMASAVSKRSNEEEQSNYDIGAIERMRFMMARGIQMKTNDSKPKQDSTSKSGASNIDTKKMQALMQQQMLKLKQQVDQNMMSNVSAVQGELKSKVVGLSLRMDQLQKTINDFKQMTDNAVAKNFEILEKRMIKLEHNQDFLDVIFKENSDKCEKFIKTQKKALEEFKKYIGEEYVDFFKNRRRIKLEIIEHAKEYRNRYRVLAALNDDYSFKFNYLDAIIPVLAEQNRFLYNMVLQDMAVREGLSKTLSKSPNPAHNGFLLLEQIRGTSNNSNSIKNDQISKELQNLQMQINHLAKGQNLLQDLDTAKTSLGAQGNVKQGTSGTMTQQSSPGDRRKYGPTMKGPQSVEEVDQTQPASPTVVAREQASSLDAGRLGRRGTSNTIQQSKESHNQLGTKNKQGNLQYFSPHQDVLPDEFFKKRLNLDKQTGLYLQNFTYRNQNIEQPQLQKFLDKMSERIDALLENVVPLGSVWTPKMKKVQLKGNQMATKVLFDDIYFGKDIISDAGKIPCLDINKICEKFIKIDIQDQNFPQDYLNFYVNQDVQAASAQKTPSRGQIQVGQNRMKGYQTQSPQTLQNETLKSDQSNKDLDFDGSNPDGLISAQGGKYLKNRLRSSKPTDRPVIIKPQRSQSSNPKIIDQKGIRNSNMRITPSDYPNIQEENLNNSLTRSAPGTAVARKRQGTQSHLAQPKKLSNQGKISNQRNPKQFQMNVDTIGNSASLLDQSNLERKTQTILSQDNYRSQKVLDGLNRLPIQIIQNSNYQEHMTKNLNTRQQTFSVENLQDMNYTLPLSGLAARYTTQPLTSNTALTKTLLNKVAEPKGRLNQQTPLGSSTSTEMRYLSAKSNQAANAVNAGSVMKKTGQSRNIPLMNQKAQTTGKLGDMKITIMQQPNGVPGLMASGTNILQNKRSVGQIKTKTDHPYQVKTAGTFQDQS